PALGRLSEIGIPTLVITGREDHVAIQAIADSMVEEIPTAQRLKIAGASHMVNMEKPADFNQAVLDFLSNVTDSPEKN
ncbi:MAG: alpha/beta hydrolase, partial [Acidobacteriota bacterium]